MKTGRLTLLAGLLALLVALALPARANLISLHPSALAVSQGQAVMVDIRIDFADLTVGGAFDVLYDPMNLQLSSFDYNAGFLMAVGDPAFSVPPDNCFVDGSPSGGCNVGDGEVNGISFGNFMGISGQHTIGTLVFDTLKAGQTLLQTAATDDLLGGFFSADDFTPLPVDFDGAMVRVSEPLALWLMMGGLMMAGLVQRRRIG